MPNDRCPYCKQQHICAIDDIADVYKFDFWHLCHHCNRKWKYEYC